MSTAYFNGSRRVHVAEFTGQNGEWRALCSNGGDRRRWPQVHWVSDQAPAKPWCKFCVRRLMKIIGDWKHDVLIPLGVSSD